VSRNVPGSTPVECSDCGSVAVQSSRDRSQCCGRPVKEVDSEEFPVQDPDLDELLGTVFGMSRTELDVCLCVMDVGEATTKDIARELDVDRSHVSRHLNHLVELGVLEKRRRLLEEGGRVNVYTPAELEAVRRNFTLGLFAWMDEAVEVIDGISREKVESITELSDEVPETAVYHDPSD